ncbi:hypothetical protein JXA48_05320 [Candidatus Woesearchaeota archaeon]|nr:hypothetical protein [Candidatus Woesearchaeota archaeon]
MKISVQLDDDEVKILEKRAKKNILTLTEQVQDIIRRSCVSSKTTTTSRFKPDDALVEVFSRERRGRKKKKKAKKKKK